MIPPEYMPVVIEAHRNDLRRLFEPERHGTPRRPLRRRIGAIIIRFGRWVEDRCNEAASESPVAASNQRAPA